MSELKEYEVRIGRKLYQTLPPIVYVVADDNQPKLLNDKVYLKSESDKVIAEKEEEIYNIKYSRDEWAKACNQKDKEIAELKAKLEDVQASTYAESVDAGMRERRLRRALYKALANWAKSERYTEATWHGDEHREELWAEVQNKCLKKAEEYK